MIKEGQHFGPNSPPESYCIFFLGKVYMPLTHTVLVFFSPKFQTTTKNVYLFAQENLQATHLAEQQLSREKILLPFILLCFFPTFFFFPDKFRTYSPSFRERKIKRHRKNKDLLTNSSDNYSPKASKVKLFPGEQIRQLQPPSPQI